MTQRILRAIASDATGVTFADPSDVNATTRTRTVRTNKTVENQRVTNVRNEFIVNRPGTLVIGDDTVTEALSVRVTFSGSTLSETSLISMWNDAKANVDAAINSGKVLAGFPIAHDFSFVIDAEPSA